MVRSIRQLLFLAALMCVCPLNAHAGFKLEGKNIPKEAIELKGDIYEMLYEIQQLQVAHDKLVLDHDKLLTLIDQLNTGDAIDQLLADELAMTLCGQPIYAGEGSLSPEEQVSVSEYLTSCYQEFCSEIAESESDVAWLDQMLWEYEEALNSVLLAAANSTPSPAPSPMPSPMPSYAPTAAPTQTPMPISSPVTTPIPIPAPSPMVYPMITPTPIPSATPSSVPYPMNTPTPIPTPTPVYPMNYPGQMHP